MSSDAAGGGSRFPSKVVIAATAGAVVAAGAAYYVYSKSASGDSTKPKEKQVYYQPVESLKHWKEEGNKHFTQKRYAAAIECFSTVIDECEQTKCYDKKINKSAESAAQFADILAICYQNRAAAKQASEDNPLEVISDCNHAILLKPDYGKAYVRRSQLLKMMEPKQALADALAAMHLDPKFSEQMAVIMGELMGALEKRNLEDFQQRKEANPNLKPQEIIQDQIYAFLYKTLTDEYIRNIYFKKVSCSSERLNEALECIRKRDFVAALTAVVQGEEPECLLLAARLHWYRGCLEKFEECMGRFEKWASSSPDHEHFKDLQISYGLMRIETADSIANVLQLFEQLVDDHEARPDFFSIAAFKCAYLESWETAQTILSDSRLKHSTISEVLKYFIQINSVMFTGENPMEAFTIIAKFEEFVDSLDEKNEHKDYAAYALSKIYITYNNVERSEALLSDLVKKDPSWTIYTISLAHVYTQKGEYEKAAELVTKTLQAEKLNPEAQLLDQSLRLHEGGNRLNSVSFYVNIRIEADQLLARCLSQADFNFLNEVLRHISFIEAKITAAKSLHL